MPSLVSLVSIIFANIIGFAVLFAVYQFMQRRSFSKKVSEKNCPLCGNAYDELGLLNEGFLTKGELQELPDDMKEQVYNKIRCCGCNALVYFSRNTEVIKCFADR